MRHFFFSEVEGGVRLRVRVQPRSSKNEIAGVMGDELKIKITAPPVDGAANQALVRFLAGFFDVSKGEIQLAQGKSGRHKVFDIKGLSRRRLLEALSDSGIETSPPE